MTGAPPASEPAEAGRERLLRRSVAYFAENGIGDASLRQIAAGVGSSHRMLLYHFGSRDGLLEAVVDELERAERDTLSRVISQQDAPARARAWTFWTHVADTVDFYGPLYFELASRAMRGPDVQAPLRTPNIEMWLDTLAEFWSQADVSRNQARVHARMNLAVARGLLHDLLLTGDRKAVDQAMAMFDWLSFREPNPTKKVGRLSASWTAPRALD